MSRGPTVGCSCKQALSKRGSSRDTPLLALIQPKTSCLRRRGHALRARQIRRKEGNMSLKEGDSAPAFALPGTDGQTISLNSLAGKKVVLYFYPKDNTSGCTREARDFNALRARFTDADTAIVGVSPDSVA